MPYTWISRKENLAVAAAVLALIACSDRLYVWGKPGLTELDATAALDSCEKNSQSQVSVVEPVDRWQLNDQPPHQQERIIENAQTVLAVRLTNQCMATRGFTREPQTASGPD